MPKGKDLFFVGIQAILFMFFLWRGPWSFSMGQVPTVLSLSLGLFGILVLLLSILQLNRNLSPFPTPIKDGQLISTGLYKYIRHPIYTGILFMGFGFGIYTGSIFRIIVTAGLGLLFYFKSAYEEKLLCERFEDYPAFKKARGRFLPKFKFQR